MILVCCPWIAKLLLANYQSVIDSSLSSSHRHNRLYHCFVQTEYGVLGASNRVQIPECVVTYICSLGPSKDGTNKGYCDVPASHQTVENMEEEDKGSEGFGTQPVMNSSYEDVEEEAIPTPVDFGGGEKIESVVHFYKKI